MHADLIGKVYRNGEGGGLYRVVALDPDYTELVISEPLGLKDSGQRTAVAEFVRHWLVEQASG